MNVTQFIQLGVFVTLNLLALGLLYLARNDKIRVKELEEGIPNYTMRHVRVTARECLRDTQAEIRGFRFAAGICFALSVLVPVFISVVKSFFP